MSSSGFAIFSDEQIDQFVEAANKAADVAAKIIRKYYGCNLISDKKSGVFPVAIVEREVEEGMISMIQEDFPGHEVYGKVTGWRQRRHRGSSSSQSSSSLVWVLDPICGESNIFEAGYQLFSFGTLVALLYNGKPILGCIDQSLRKLRWMGIKGKPTTLNQNRVVTDSRDNLVHAYANLKAPHFSDDARYAFDRLAYKVQTTFFDPTSTVYGALACGHLHVVVDCNLSPCNFLALVPVVEGAGGVITDWQGHELWWNAHPSNGIPEGGYRVVAAADVNTHHQIIESLSY